MSPYSNLKDERESLAPIILIRPSGPMAVTEENYNLIPESGRHKVTTLSLGLGQW